MEHLSTTNFVGWLASAMLFIAWFPKTLETIIKKECQTNILFLILYVSSSFLFVLYSFLIEDIIFLTLNITLFLGSSINLYYRIKTNVKP